MNVTITFYSDEYASYINKRIDEAFPDTAQDLDRMLYLQKLSHEFSEVFIDYIVPNNIDREELLDDNDATVRLLALLQHQFENHYPDTSLIGFYPIDLHGNLIAILHSPQGCVFNITCIR